MKNIEKLGSRLELENFQACFFKFPVLPLNVGVFYFLCNVPQLGQAPFFRPGLPYIGVHNLGLSCSLALIL